MARTDRAVGRVLMTADPIGGVWTYALELAKQLARAGVRTTLATMGGPLRPAQRAAAERIEGCRVSESDFKLEWMDSPWADVAQAGRWLLGLEKSIRPDVVHLNGYVHASLPWRAPRVVVAHSCVMSWWSAVRCGPAPAEFSRYRREVARGLRAAQAVVAPTRAMLADLRAHYQAPEHGLVIPNGLEPGPDPQVAKEPFVLAAGRLWDPAKNVSALASIAARLPWPLYVAGSEGGPDRTAGRHHGLRLLGFLDPADLHSWMARATIYALPACYEPFGLTFLEAAARGCALVAGDIASLREIWDGAALFVPPHDRNALLRAIERLANDRDGRAAMARAARERARRFGGDRMRQRYLQLYHQLLGQPVRSCA